MMQLNDHFLCRSHNIRVSVVYLSDYQLNRAAKLDNYIMQSMYNIAVKKPSCISDSKPAF